MLTLHAIMCLKFHLGLTLGYLVDWGFWGIWVGMVLGTVVQTIVLLCMIYRTNWNKELKVLHNPKSIRWSFCRLFGYARGYSILNPGFGSLKHLETSAIAISLAELDSNFRDILGSMKKR